MPDTLTDAAACAQPRHRRVQASERPQGGNGIAPGDRLTIAMRCRGSRVYRDGNPTPACGPRARGRGLSEKNQGQLNLPLFVFRI
jgi:hypothetical protein